MVEEAMDNVAGRPGYSLSSTQQIHAKKGSKHRMCGRLSLGGPRSTATAVVKGQCLCSSDADVQYYGFKSIFSSIYQ